MLKVSALHSRLLFVFCAAVMSFIMCSDAASASPITTQVDTGVRHKVLKRLYTPTSQYHPISTGLLSAETGLETGTNTGTETGRNYREFSSIINHQSKPLQFIDSSFGYNQNIPDKREFPAGITRVQSEVRSASSIFTSHSQQHGGQSVERPQSRVNYQPLSRKVAQSGNSYHSHPVIIRKSSHKEAAGPFHQSSGPSLVWDPKDAQKSHNKEKLPGNGSPKVAVWQPSDSSLFSSQAGRYWSTSLPASRGQYSGYKETNELAAVGPWSTSSGIESSNFLGFTSQTAPHAPSISNSLDASVIKSNPSPEKPPSSITYFSQGLSSSETPRQKNIRSYLFKDSQTSIGGHKTVNTVSGDGHSTFSTTLHKQSPSDAQVYSRFSSNLKQSGREEPTNKVQHLSNVNPVYHNPNRAQYGAQTGNLPQKSGHPAPGTGGTLESAVPTSHKVFLGNYAPAVTGQVNTTKAGQTTKTIYGFRGFTNPMRRAEKEPSIPSPAGSNERTNSQRFRFDKGKFKITNKYPSLSPKYRFGQREPSTTTTSPAKLERTPSPGILDVVQTMRLFPSGVKEVLLPLPESDAGVESNPDRRQFRIHRRIYGLKGFSSRPHDGAKPLLREADKSSRVLQGFGGFKPRSSQIQRWFNKTEAGSSHVSTESQSALKPTLKTAESTEAATSFTPDRYKGFHPAQNRTGNAFNTYWKYKGQNPTPASASRIIPSVYFRSAGDLKVESSQRFEPRTPNKTRLAAMKASLLSSSTSSTVRGKRVKGTHRKKLNELTSLTNGTGKVAIVRLPKWPARVKAVTYADILGSASFSGVRATTQTPITPADKNYSTTATATTEQKEGAGHWTLNSEDAVYSRDNTSRAEEEVRDFSTTEENKLGEEVDSDMKTLDLFLDNEGSGSGAFNVSDVLSTDTTKSQGFGEDLLELDYLQISTGNISFKSMKLSTTDK